MDNILVILRSSISNIVTVFNLISFSIADEETKATPKPRLTAVLIASIEFNCRMVFN